MLIQVTFSLPTHCRTQVEADTPGEALDKAWEEMFAGDTLLERDRYRFNIAVEMVKA